MIDILNNEYLTLAVPILIGILEDVDIITYLISELKAIETVEADRIIAEAERRKKGRNKRTR